MNFKKNKFLLGILLGVIVGLAWGLDGVLMGEVGNSIMFSDFELSPLVTALFHDGFAFFWIALSLIFSKQLLGAFKLLKTKKRFSYNSCGNSWSSSRNECIFVSY